MNARASLCLRRLCTGGMTLGLVAPFASGHVNLDAPNGGEVFDAGSIHTITWHVAVSHDTQNWDLWYSTGSNDGPWTEIAVDLPPGDTDAGAVHTYAWTVPDVADDTVWVRVQQDNSGTDYDGVSAGPFAIAACGWDIDGNGTVGFSDLTQLLKSWGACPVPPAVCPADIDGNGTVGFNDLIEMLGAWGACS